jgi:hypothetical protein
MGEGLGWLVGELVDGGGAVSSACDTTPCYAGHGAEDNNQPSNMIVVVSGSVKLALTIPIWSPNFQFGLCV